jgi:hypothetical protein
MDETDKRVLTDSDVGAIADALEKRIVSKFYLDLGRGVWSLVWKAVLTAAVVLAAYGAVKGKLP